jgi:hypothetical protein
MTDPDQKHWNDNGETSRRLEESVASGRITPAEAEVIKLFFASRPQGNWPASGLQRRMQDLGG